MLSTVPTPSGEARVDLRRPKGTPHGLLVLTHGAGGDADTVDLLAAGEAALALGVALALVTQPFRVAGRGAPSAPAKQDAAWLAIVSALRRRRGLGSVPLILGGRSNGARVACRTAAACGADGVLALAFPVHPPGRPEKSRLDELDAVEVPVLVVQGAKDTFGMPPAADHRQVVVLDRDGHGLNRDPEAVGRATTSFVTSILERARVGS